MNIFNTEGRLWWSGQEKWICIIFKLYFIKPFGNRHLVVFTLTCMAIKSLGLKL